MDDGRWTRGVVPGHRSIGCVHKLLISTDQGRKTKDQFYPLVHRPSFIVHRLLVLAPYAAVQWMTACITKPPNPRSILRNPPKREQRPGLAGAKGRERWVTEAESSHKWSCGGRQVVGEVAAAVVSQWQASWAYLWWRWPSLFWLSKEVSRRRQRE
jgi:hypothetical protein